MYSFKTSFCTVPESFRTSIPAAGATRHKARAESMRSIDGHRCRNRRESMPSNRCCNVFDRVNRYAHFADFAHRQWVVGIEPDLRGQIKRY